MSRSAIGQVVNEDAWDEDGLPTWRNILTAPFVLPILMAQEVWYDRHDIPKHVWIWLPFGYLIAYFAVIAMMLYSKLLKKRII